MSNSLSIDSVELAHLNDLRAWRTEMQTQLAIFAERVTTYQKEVDSADIMERGHLAFLGRKYGALSVNPDGTLVYPVVETPAIVAPDPAVVDPNFVSAAPVFDTPVSVAPVDLAPNIHVTETAMTQPDGAPLDPIIEPASVIAESVPNDPAGGSGT